MQRFVQVAIGILAATAVALLVLMLLPLAGVPIGFGPFSSQAPSPSVSASPSVLPSEVPSDSGSAAPSGAASIEPTGTPTEPTAEWICGLPVTVAATGAVVLHTADIRVETHTGFDRIVFEYLEDGNPAFEMRNARPPFVEDASGLPMTVTGANVMSLSLNGATKLGDDGSLTYTGPTEFAPGFPQLVHLTERGDFEAVNSWYVGLNGSECIRAAVVNDPSRVVVDIQH